MGEDRPTGPTGQRYGFGTIILHWLTALLVVTNFALAQTWRFMPSHSPQQGSLKHLHISFGVMLAAVLSVRIVWRLTHRHRFPDTAGRLAGVAARTVHFLFYGLLVAMVLTGLGKRWIPGRPVVVFGLPIPPPFAFDPSWRPYANDVHHYLAWTIIILSSLHTVAALLHHYGRRDGVLRRMLPGRRRKAFVAVHNLRL
ncbi:cytochrome b [Lichenicola cladoniae]|uniref:Cytochrome b n=1 Tax=Lichenicola cladoniae TaxID=1484109 RepID=A0A6M8HQM3_9PROT|nr:cytochrome b [Lichenicola cladoniae]NPD68002.1 cytochrome b [Acetobacteraceae bacterium]QKE90587.1 cytochrome b [Lichenicola cladoniae]